MVPNGSLNGSLPANGFPPGALWHAAQSAARARYSPRATNSGDGATSGADISGSRSSRRHETAKPAITRTVDAATPMIPSHLDPIIFMVNPIVEGSRTSNLGRAGSPGGRWSSSAALLPGVIFRTWIERRAFAPDVRRQVPTKRVERLRGSRRKPHRLASYFSRSHGRFHPIRHKRIMSEPETAIARCEGVRDRGSDRW